jgi:hypothetical protein
MADIEEQAFQQAMLLPRVVHASQFEFRPLMSIDEKSP